MGFLKLGLKMNKGDKIRVFARKSGQQLWDAIVVKGGDEWFGMRPRPEKERTEDGDEYTINMNQDAFELFPVNSPVFRYEHLPTD